MRGEEVETMNLDASSKKGSKEIRGHSWRETGSQERALGWVGVCVCVCVCLSVCLSVCLLGFW